MNLRELVALQHKFDDSHGWSPKTESDEELLKFIGDDIVGLVGELGEFANQAKKLKLMVGRKDAELAEAMMAARPALSEELVDTLIYIMRLASHLGVDLELEYLRKLEVNQEKFQQYLRGGETGGIR